MLALRVAYGLKNFHSHMGIRNNVTLGGLLRRSARRYPRVYNLLSKGSLLCGIYFVMMSLIPGTSLPLQTPIKMSLLASSRIAAHLWYYNIFTPQPEHYLIKLNEIVLAGLDQQIYSVQFLGQYFDEVKELMEEERKGLKQDAYLDLLLYSEIILQNIIRYQKRLLLQPVLYDHLEWTFTSVFDRVETVSDKQQKHIRLLYSVIQYLLNFAKNGKQQKVIQTYHRLATKKNNTAEENSFGTRVMKAGLKQKQFLSFLKQLYSNTNNQQLRQQIMQIFEALHKLYQEKN